MKNALILLICFVANTLFAHESREHALSKQWFIARDNKTIQASFMILKDNVVYLENEQSRITKYPLSALTAADKSFVLDKCKQIEMINNQPLTRLRSGNFESFPNVWDVLRQNVWLIGLFVFLLASFVYAYQKREKIRYVYAVLMGVFMGGLYSFAPNPPPTTDPLFIDSAFVPFKSKVKTRWDATYFYVESLGLPTHPMMKGITNWQQQVPTPKCYVGANAWSIPLNPVVAATPVSTRTNFFKGAIGLAANGIPIFNAYNNRGEDSYLLGELDQYGGHCGKGDDYHYHIAPLSLDSVNAAILPIAFALDGFAVYGDKEPNGLTMNTLDANNGHYLNGVYHYHGTKIYPYMVGNMVGVVTKDATDQIIPQPTGNPFRPAGNPLNGAAITACTPNGTGNGYNLTYTLAGQNYAINYSWTTSAAAYTFNFVSPTAGTTTANYTGQTCNFSTKTAEILDNSGVELYPNPARNGFSLTFKSPVNVNDIQAITIVNLQGQVVFKTKNNGNFTKIPFYTEGSYFVNIQFSNSQIVKKLIVQ
jgi:Secretion system C-terminal sorting domain/YHYH protein